MEIPNDDLKEIKKLLYDLNLNMKVLMNYKFTDKMRLLEEKLILVKVLDVNQVMVLLDTSRNHALELMKRLPNRRPLFKFYIGSKELQSPSRIVYIEEEMLKNDFEALWDVIPMNGDTLSVSQIAESLNLNITVYLDYLTDLIQKFADKFSDIFEVIDENKIRRKKPLLRANKTPDSL